MAASPRNVLLVAGLAVAAVLVAVGTRLREPARTAPAGLTRAGDAPPPAAPAARRDDGASEPVQRSVAPPAERTSWDVRAMSGEGALLSGARITATAPDGETALVATGRAQWDDVAPGEWRLVVEHDGYPRYEGTYRVEAGLPNRKIVRLSHDLQIGGRVVDRFGEPRTGERLWFLRPGERHPHDGATAQSLVGCVADRAGRFSVTLPEAGSWRISVGGVSRPVSTMERPEQLWLGGPEHVEIVLADTTRLVVECSGAPGAFQEPLTVQVLEHVSESERYEETQAEILGDDLLAGGTRGESLAQLERLRAAGALGALPAEALEDGEALDGQEGELARRPPLPLPTPRPTSYQPQWIGRASLRVGHDGRVEFPSLPANRELRLGLTRPGARYESTQTFVLRPDERAVVRLTVPQPPATSPVDETDDGTSDQAPLAPLPLPIEFRSTPLPADLRPAGFHWR